MYKKPKVGDNVFQQKKTEVVTFTVTKVAKKYFYAKTPCSWDIKVDLEDWCEINCFGNRFPVYESVEAINNLNENNEIIKLIKKTFVDFYGTKEFQIEKMREIKRIIESNVVVI